MRKHQGPIFGVRISTCVALYIIQAWSFIIPRLRGFFDKCPRADAAAASYRRVLLWPGLHVSVKLANQLRGII
jgi:hypothetical protein